MKRRNKLKAGILLTILLLILPVSVESVQATLDIGPIRGVWFGIGTNITTTVTTDVDWTISVTGGLIIPGTGGSVRMGHINQLQPNDNFKIIRTFWGFGFIPIGGIGPMSYTVTATPTSGGPQATRTGGPTHLLFILVW
jgi:hypothetical protein